MAEFFVTGTDTDVGKTLVTAALLHAAGARGLRTTGIKPLAAGARPLDGAWVNDDALLLRAASSAPLGYAATNPVLLRAAMAPHLAAAAEGVALDATALAAHCGEAARHGHDLLLAEGAGGWLVPLNDRETLADVAAALGWPVVLVVGLRLGCLNHALLTAAAIRAAGLRLAGWVANQAWPEMAAAAENVATLEARLGAPRLGTLPWLGAAPAPAAAAQALDIGPLLEPRHA
jgi:dethiobiotin synthetase